MEKAIEYNVTEAYNLIIRYALDGHQVTPRGKLTYELPGPLAVLTSAYHTPIRTGMSLRLAITEAMMLISGIFDVGIIKKVAPTANLDLYEKQSDYGPRIADQLPTIIDLFDQDIYTRRAVAYFNDLRHFGTDDLACTTSIQWQVRDEHLLTHVTLRSWDLVYGFPMDIMMYGLLSQAISFMIKGHPILRNLHITATNAHVYANTSHKGYSSYACSYALTSAWSANKTWADVAAMAFACLEICYTASSKEFTKAISPFIEIKTVQPEEQPLMLLTVIDLVE